MAVLGRLLVSSAERLDLPDLLSIDSYTAGDFKYLIKGLVGDSRPYVLRGFEVIDPVGSIGTQTCSIKVADSVVFYPGSNSGSFFHGLQEGHEQAIPLTPELRKNATNYVYLTFNTLNTSVDTRAFWDPDKDGGIGGEYTQDVNTESVLKVEVNVSTGSFPSNTIPIAIIKMGATTIESIEDGRDLMFRLGSGGSNPNPFSKYTWRSSPISGFERKEPPTAAISGASIDPFKGADKNIQSLKEWMDAIMSKLSELGGSTYWYEDISTYSLISCFIDANATAFKSKGSWLHDTGTPGLLTWSEDLNMKVTSDIRSYIVRQGSKTLSDEQVMYVPLVRNQSTNTYDKQVSWINGVDYVNTINGVVGLFANLSKGDYIKKISDSNDKFLRVEEFYDSINPGPLTLTTTSALAKSIKLSGAYTGTTAEEEARYDKGIYLSSDVVVSDRNTIDISNTGGNFHWLAIRSDTIQNISNIESTTLTVDIERHDGTSARVTSSSPHGLVDGDRITISESTNFNGTYKVEVETDSIFYITISNTPIADELAVTATYATVTTTTRSTDYGLQLESANHGLKNNDTVILSDTNNYNGDYLVSVRSATQFTIAVPPDQGPETSGIARLAKLIVRTDGSVSEIIQGEIVNIDGPVTANIKTYMGMSSLSETYPTYVVPTAYNTLDGMADYNGVVNENLTARISRLTSMMANKAQDKTIKIVPSGFESVTNTTNGTAQDITFNAYTPPGRLDIIMPGSDYSYGTVILDGVLSLNENQAAYILLDRNNTFTVSDIGSIIVNNITDVPVDENVLIIATRIGTGEVWLWDGFYMKPDSTTSTHYELDKIVKQNRTLKMVYGGIWSWDLLNSKLTSSDPAYIQVPGLNIDRNTVDATSGIVLLNDGDVAYVDINRRDPGSSDILSINVSAISSLGLHEDRVIIARRVNNNVEVGTGTMMLVHGDLKALDADDALVKVKVIDVSSTSLPSGTSLSIDGVSLSNGDRVLFADSSLNGVYAIDGVGSSISFTRLDCFAGFDVPYEGSQVAVQDGSSEFRTVWSHFEGNWRQLSHSKLVGEPTGLPNRVDSILSFSSSTFTISPTGDHFDVYQKGRPYRFTSSQSLTKSWSQGLHYIYFDNGVLDSTQVFTPAIIKQYAFVATMYWDSSSSTHIMLGDERHGLTMDGETHAYLHQSVGMRYISGLSADNFTTSGAGSLDSDAQMSISNGSVRDEDISFDIKDADTPSNAFEQILDPIANIPIIYRSGVNGDWKIDAATTFPLKQGTSRAQWNQYSGGSWSTVDASADDNYVAVWLFSTNNQDAPIVGVLGQREDITLNDAEANNVYEQLLFGDMPSAEMKVIYRVIFKTNSTYSNTPKTVVAAVQDLRKAIDTALGPYSPSDHGLLSGLTDQDHPDYAIRVEDPAAYTGALKQVSLTDNDDVQKALQSLDRFFGQLRIYPHPSDPHRVKISGADHSLTNNITLSQAVRGLMLSFDGAEIDFSTGSIYEADGITPLGVDFVPTVIPSNEYNWYSLSLKISTSASANNTISASMLVTSASSTNAVLDDAPRADFKGSIKLGQVWIKEDSGSIADITTSNIYQLGNTSEDYSDSVIKIEDPTVYDGALKQINTTDNDDVQKALQSLDRFFGQLRMYPHSSNANRIRISGSNHSLMNDITLTQVVKNVIMSFDGAEIDFSTGSIYEADGITPLGVDFVPTTIPSGEYHWYSVGISAILPILANNTIKARLMITAATDTNAVLDDASRANFRGDIRLGQVWVKEDSGSIAGITASNIHQLGVGFVGTGETSNGGGSGLQVYSFDLINNQSTPQNVTDFFVDSSSNKTFKSEYSISRRYENTVYSPYGQLDISFNSNYFGGVGYSPSVTAVQSDGKILVGGYFYFYVMGYGYVINLARFNADGTFDTSFSASTNLSVNAIAIQSDGKILIGGAFTFVNSSPMSHLARLNTDGSLDTGFAIGSGFNNDVYAITIDNSGKILVGGAFTTYNSFGTGPLVRLLSDGSRNATLQATYLINMNNSVNAIAVQSDDKILVGGTMTMADSIGLASPICRLFSDGSTDISFLSPSAYTYANYISIQSDGKIVVSAAPGAESNIIYRHNTDGSLDPGFTPPAVSGNNYYTRGNCHLIQSDGKIIVGGRAYNGASYGSFYSAVLHRLNSDGSLDTSFENYAVIDGSIINWLTLQPTLNKVLVSCVGDVHSKVSTVFRISPFDRTSTTTNYEYVTQGSMSGIYRPSTLTWSLVGETYVGDDPEVELSITNTGQVQYTSSNLPGTELESMLKFSIIKL